MSPLAAASVSVAGAISRAVAARGVAAGPRLLFLWQAQYPEPLEGVAARAITPRPRLKVSLWQAQYPEPLEAVAAPMRVWQLAVRKRRSG